MRLWKSWIVTQKDLSVFKKNKYVLYSLVAMPIIMGVVLPVIFIFALNSEAVTLPRAQLLACRQQIDKHCHNVTSCSLLNSCLLLLPPTVLSEKKLRKASTSLATPPLTGNCSWQKFSLFHPMHSGNFSRRCNFCP